MGAFDNFLDKMKLTEEVDDNEYYDEEEVEERPSRKPQNAERRVAERRRVMPMKQPQKKSGSSSEIVVIKPSSIDDGREITNTLLANRSVLLNLEGLDLDIAQRIIDFTSGSCFAMSGNMQKISNSIFIITPPTVEISGDFQEILSGTGSIDLPSINTEL